MNTFDKQRKKKAYVLMRQQPGKLEPVNLDLVEFIPKGMTRAFSNNRYVVMVYDSSPVANGTATRVMVQKHDDTPIVRHWSELQAIKNALFGPETVAIEYYPAQSQLIDDHNIYWLWIYPPGALPMPIL